MDNKDIVIEVIGKLHGVTITRCCSVNRLLYEVCTNFLYSKTEEERIQLFAHIIDQMYVGKLTREASVFFSNTHNIPDAIFRPDEENEDPSELSIIRLRSVKYGYRFEMVRGCFFFVRGITNSNVLTDAVNELACVCNFDCVDGSPTLFSIGFTCARYKWFYASTFTEAFENYKKYFNKRKLGLQLRIEHII